MAEPGSVKTTSSREKKVPSLIERGKEEMEAIVHSPGHQKETHGKSEDIDENTPVEEVKGPGVFQRAKEEIEAVVGSVIPPHKKN